MWVLLFSIHQGLHAWPTSQINISGLTHSHPGFPRTCELVGVSMGSFMSLVMVWQGFCTANSKTLTKTRPNPLRGPRKYLLRELEASENTKLSGFYFKTAGLCKLCGGWGKSIWRNRKDWGFCFIVSAPYWRGGLVCVGVRGWGGRMNGCIVQVNGLCVWIFLCRCQFGKRAVVVTQFSLHFQVEVGFWGHFYCVPIYPSVPYAILRMWGV